MNDNRFADDYPPDDAQFYDDGSSRQVEPPASLPPSSALPLWARRIVEHHQPGYAPPARLLTAEEFRRRAGLR